MAGAMDQDRPFEEDAPLAEATELETGEAATAAGAAPPAEPADSAVKRLSEQLAEVTDRHLRLAAEFDNFRKRVARERVELADKAQAAFVIKLLDVLDDLDRLAATDPDGPIAALRQGIEMVDRKFRKELEQGGLERVDPVGQKFDPAVAEAVSVIAPPEAAQDHTVAATFQVGYRFKGALVRPAMVQVYSSEGHA
ncbi:MAG: nucleotide exchange factor GrpE [Gemmatimonadales bacterium]